jgi:hypothetical protein
MSNLAPLSPSNQAAPGTWQKLAPFSGAIAKISGELRRHELGQRTVDMANVPIDFYGKVVDQDSNALAGALVSVAVRHWSIAILNGLPDPAAQPHLQVITGPDGRFQLSGATGDGFDLASVTKEGYELQPSRRSFGPTEGNDGSPIIFKMWSTNSHEHLLSGQRSFEIVPDGRTYLVNLSRGTIAESGSGDLKIWAKRPEQIKFGTHYDWSCEIQAADGSEILLAANGNEPMYEAPTTGYTNSFTYEQSATMSGWGDTTGPQRFYVRLNNRLNYGRITIEIEVYYNKDIPGLVRLSYALNPSGSRILR